MSAFRRVWSLAPGSGRSGLLARTLVFAAALGSCATPLRPTVAAPAPVADASAFVVRTFRLGNEGSVTPNARRYAITRDWATLAAPRDDGTVALFDVATGQPTGAPLEGGFDVGTFTFSGGPQPSYFAFSSDGSLLVWSWGKKVVVWDVATGGILLKREIEDFEDWKGGVHLSPDGRYLAWTTEKGVTLWDLSERRVSETLTARGLCDFSPDGRHLALRSSIWDLEHGQPLVDALGALCLGYSPDGRSLLTAGPDGVELRDLTASRSSSLATNAWFISKPARSADGRFLAFLNGDSDSEVWDIGTEPPVGRALPEREKGNRGRCVEFDTHGRRRRSAQLVLSHDGRVLCDSCRITDIWDLSEPTPRLLVRTGLLPLTVGRPALSPDGRVLAYPWGDGRHLHGKGGFALWDIANGTDVGPRVELGSLGAMEFSPDGRLLAAAGWGAAPDGKDGFVVQLWSVERLRSGGTAGHQPSQAVVESQ